jgi:hypothetical protein
VVTSRPGRIPGKSGRFRSGQRLGFDALKPEEVPVVRPDRLDAVLTADRGDLRFKDEVSRGPGVGDRLQEQLREAVKPATGRGRNESRVTPRESASPRAGRSAA